MAISADLGEALEKVVRDLVDNGRYNSKSEVLREGVRLVQEREARHKLLSGLIAAAEEDVTAGRVHSAEAVFEELQGRYGAGIEKGS